jgi:hypothetical protein
VAGSAATFNSEGGTGIASSSKRGTGTVIGFAFRIDSQISATVGIGYNSGTVESAGASASVNTGVLTIGGPRLATSAVRFTAVWLAQGFARLCSGSADWRALNYHVAHDPWFLPIPLKPQHENSASKPKSQLPA